MDLKIDDIKAYCLHLKNAKDRTENMTNELNSFTSNWEIFDAIWKQPGYIGISESFKSIIRKAKEDGYKQVLIFEDDVKFTSSKSKEQFQKCIDSLPEDWDVLLGGIYALTNMKDLENESINDCIKKIGDFSALHCTLLNHTVYDKILKHDPLSKDCHLDRYIGKMSRYTVNTYVCYPMIAIQQSEYSDSGHCRRRVNYDRYLRRFELFE